MSDARWREIDNDVASAARHFRLAAEIYADGGLEDDTKEGYKSSMAFMHAMTAGHTSMETAMRRILAMVGEEAPVGHDWHLALVRRLAQALGGRPALLTNDLAAAAQKTRQFRHVALRTYDDFDPDQAAGAVTAALFVAAELAPAIAAFRRAIDPDEPTLT